MWNVSTARTPVIDGSPCCQCIFKASWSSLLQLVSRSKVASAFRVIWCLEQLGVSRVQWTEEEFLPSEAHKGGWAKGGEGGSTFIDQEVKRGEHHQGRRRTEWFNVLTRTSGLSMYI